MSASIVCNQAMPTRNQSTRLNVSWIKCKEKPRVVSRGCL